MLCATAQNLQQQCVSGQFMRLHSYYETENNCGPADHSATRDKQIQQCINDVLLELK